MFDTIPEFRHRLRIFTPRGALKTLIEHYRGEAASGYACRGGIDFFFIDSKDMNAYPRGFRGGEKLGKFEDINPRSLDSEPWCRQCDRECFRAPSEFVGPFVDLFQHPIRLIKKFANDGEHARLWLEDLKYFQACDYFDAMRPPNREKLARHEPRSPATRWADPNPARL